MFSIVTPDGAPTGTGPPLLLRLRTSSCGDDETLEAWWQAHGTGC